MTASATVLAAFVLLVAAAGGSQDTRTQEGARQRAPESFLCDRNHLTFYTGIVRTYRRQVASTTLPSG